MKKAILSLSGGLDSTALLLHLIEKGYDVHTISYFYGQKNKVELDGLARILHYLEYKGYVIPNQRVDLSSVFGSFNSSLTSSDVDVPTGKTTESKMKMNFVPNRNAIFSSVLYGFAVSITKEHDDQVDVCLGVHAGDGNVIPPDCTPEFYNKLEDAFKIGNINTDNINYYLPYVDKKKFNIVEDAHIICKSLGLDFKYIFENSISCYNGDGCGKCGACTDRILAFNKAGIEDVTKYVGEINE
jgi:7-cyano-7-deazaguanine synthase